MSYILNDNFFNRCWDYDWNLFLFFFLFFQPKHSDGDIRVILANFILNFEIPRDLYMVAAFLLSVYLTIRLFRFSIRLILSLVRPLIFIGIFLVSNLSSTDVTFLYQTKKNILILVHRCCCHIYTIWSQCFHQVTHVPTTDTSNICPSI